MYTWKVRERLSGVDSPFTLWVLQVKLRLLRGALSHLSGLLVYFFETGSHYITLAGFKLKEELLPSPPKW